MRIGLQAETGCTSGSFRARALAEVAGHGCTLFGVCAGGTSPKAKGTGRAVQKYAKKRLCCVQFAGKCALFHAIDMSADLTKQAPLTVPGPASAGAAGFHAGVAAVCRTRLERGSVASQQLHCNVAFAQRLQHCPGFHPCSDTVGEGRHVIHVVASCGANATPAFPHIEKCRGSTACCKRPGRAVAGCSAAPAMTAAT